MMKPASLNGSRLAALGLPLTLIAHDLEEVERIYQEALNPFRARFGSLLTHLKHYRGKRLRPALVLLTGHACGQVTKHHHILGAVVEMIHTATLVHDDVLDDAKVRRHVPTVNAQWGNKASILLGDMLFSAAFRLCSTVDAQACGWIGDATNRVCAGELLQVTQAGNLHLTAEDYFEIVGGKTGCLTECCTRVGAHYAGATATVTDALAHYGRSLGMAFQIADDVLDLQGDASTVGKTLGTDLAQQKLTLPLIRLLEQLPTHDADALRLSLVANDADAVLAQLHAHNMIDAVHHEAVQLAQTAKEALAVVSHSTYRTALERITDWSIRREC